MKNCVLARINYLAMCNYYPMLTHGVWTLFDGEPMEEWKKEKDDFIHEYWFPCSNEYYKVTHARQYDHWRGRSRKKKDIPNRTQRKHGHTAYLVGKSKYDY